MNEQVVDNHTRIDHAVPNCNSFEVYKGILGGRATGVFNGKIYVYLDAQKTDAKQTNQAIPFPHCYDQHEAPARDLRGRREMHPRRDRRPAPRGLLSTCARCIPLNQARAILVYAFAAEVLEKISVDAVREALEKVLFDRLNETAGPPAGGGRAWS